MYLSDKCREFFSKFTTSVRNKKSAGYRTDIQGLRALSVLAVIVCHTKNSFLPGGFAGVDIFFVISGYVVTASILSRNETEIDEYLSNFYKRRIRRIFPALIFCVLITLILSLLVVPAQSLSKMLPPAYLSLVGLSNLHFMDVSADYFGLAQTYNPFTHTWSLGVEEQFYLVMPFLLLFGAGLARKSDSAAENKYFSKSIFLLFLLHIVSIVLLKIDLNSVFYNKLKNIIPVALTCFIFVVIYRTKNPFSLGVIFAAGFLLLCTLLSLAFSAYFTKKHPLISYFFLPSRLWQLSAGATLLLIQRANLLSKFNPAKNILSVLYIIGFLLIIYTFFANHTPGVYPYPWGVPVTIGALFLIAFHEYAPKFIRYPLGSNIMVFTGEISYSLYLWHWPIFVLLKWTLGMNNWIMIAVAYILTLFMALMSYHFIETPFRQSGSKFSILAPTATIFVLVFVIIGIQKKYFLNDTYIFKELAKKVPENHLIKMECHSVPPKELERCLSLERTAMKPNYIFVVVDSHAGHLIPTIKQVIKDSKFQVIQYTGGQFNTRVNLSSEGAKVVLKVIEEKIQQGDMVFITGDRAYGYDPYKDYYEYDALLRGVEVDILKRSANTRNEARMVFSAIAEALDKKGAKLLFAGDTPKLASGAIAACLIQKSIGSPNSCDVPKAISKLHASPVNSLYKDIAKLNHVYFWNPHDLLCEKEICSFESNSSVNYFDRDHLTLDTALFLAPYLKNFLMKNNIIAK